LAKRPSTARAARATGRDDRRAACGRRPVSSAIRDRPVDARINHRDGAAQARAKPGVVSKSRRRAPRTAFLGFGLRPPIKQAFDQCSHQIPRGDLIEVELVAHDMTLHRRIDNFGDLVAAESAETFGA